MITIPNITLFDLGIALTYLIIIYVFAYRYKKKQVVKNPEYRYFLFGLTAKILGSLAFVVISIYYYKRGDTFLYFQIAEDLRQHLFENTQETFELLFTSYFDLSEASYNPLEKYNYYYERSTNWVFGRIVFLFNFLSFGSYLVTSILMALVSFLGLWSGYRTMCKLYHSTTLLLIPFFLIPTALIWASGLLKDSIIIGAIGLLLSSFSNVFVFRFKVLLNISFIVVTVFISYLLKPIIVFILLPCLIYWGLLYLIKPIKQVYGRVGIKIAMVLIIIGIAYLFNQFAIEPTSKYRIENLTETLKGYQSFHSMEVFSKGQNVYTLGEFKLTPLEIVKKIPKAINVTFFRPYLWEVNNFPMLLGAIESFLLLMFFIYVLITCRKSIVRIILRNYEIHFMLLFSVLYAVVVGISSYNFGALSRYKIPSVLFFILSFIIILKQRSTKKIKSE